ncbi:MAG: glycosyltransferase, partial [Planctomycetota bacterium]
QYNLLKRTTYINVSESKLAKRIRAAAKTMATFMRHPILVYRLQKKLLEDYSSYSYPKLFLALELIHEKCDIIHCHYGTVGNQAVFLKDIGLRAKISTVFHGFDLSSYLKSHGLDVYSELFEKGDLFLPVSKFWENKLIELGCPPEKISVNHMGIDTEKFTPRKKELPQNKIKVLTVARLTEKKGHCYALQAIRQAVRIVPKLEYHIAGDGPLLKELKGLTKKLGTENNVVFHGKVNSDEVLAMYKAADIFLLPSVTPSTGDMEGIPVSLMEAMSCGLPVIASQHSGIPELVLDGQSGYTVPEKDIRSIADQIIYLAENDKVRCKLGKQAREYVELNFNNRIVLDQLLEIFRGVLDA